MGIGSDVVNGRAARRTSSRLPWNLLLAFDQCYSGWARLADLEVEPRLEGYGARTESGRILSEVGRLDVIGDAAAIAGAAGFEVQVVEKVEGVGADLNSRTFAY